MGNEPFVCECPSGLDHNKIITQNSVNQKTIKVLHMTGAQQGKNKSGKSSLAKSVKNRSSTIYRQNEDNFPFVSGNVLEIMQKNSLFNRGLKQQFKITYFGKCSYEGETNQMQQPHGAGTLFYPTGSVLMGHFECGVANGQAVFISNNGSIYKGNILCNMCEDQNGFFQSDSIKYEGGFFRNLFHGKGIEVGEDYIFEGIYENGKKKQGCLKWRSRLNQTQNWRYSLDNVQKKIKEFSRIQQEFDYQYVGKFDKNQQFSGQATLKTPKGVYEGNFFDGKKQGKGIFTFNDGLKYEGQYLNGLKQGKGKITTKNGRIAYCGEMKNGLPHGKGYLLDRKGDRVDLEWIEGVCGNFNDVKSTTVAEQ